jgi:hypothetical protein
MIENTYVYEGTEVRKTGRTAVKKIHQVNSKFRELILVEITPVSEFDWKKWVSPDQLYEVISNENK